MNIKLFLEISKEFFDSIYSQGIDYEDSCEESADEEKGEQENDDEELCYCNGCYISRQFLSFISSNFLKHDKYE
jgi:hypothetical protein